MNQVCKECKIEKDIEEFERAYPLNHPSNLRRKTCRYCRSSYHEEYRNANRGKMRLRDKEKYWSMSPDERAKYIKKKSESNSKRKGITEKRKKYNESDKGKYASYRNDSMRRYRNFEWNLSLEEFSSLFHGNCNYCGKVDCRGIDRVDSKLGYNISNCVSCCARCNEMKMDSEINEFTQQITAIYEYFVKGKV